MRAGVPVHDPVRLAAAYRDLFDGVYGDVDDETPSEGTTRNEEVPVRGTDR